MFERVLNTPLQLYLFHALQLKKCEDKAYQYQSVQRFKDFQGIHLRETYPSLILILCNCHKRNYFKIHSLTKDIHLSLD